MQNRATKLRGHKETKLHVMYVNIMQITIQIQLFFKLN